MFTKLLFVASAFVVTQNAGVSGVHVRSKNELTIDPPQLHIDPPRVVDPVPPQKKGHVEVVGPE